MLEKIAGGTIKNTSTMKSTLPPFQDEPHTFLQREYFRKWRPPIQYFRLSGNIAERINNHNKNCLECFLY